MSAVNAPSGNQPKSTHHFRFHVRHEHLTGAFGSGSFGVKAEAFARFFGTPVFLIAQTVIVSIWIILNVIRFTNFDPYPFILLNLAFSLQAAYAAPLILLAQTRQAERDKVWSDADAKHRQELAENTLKLLQQNTDLTEHVAKLSRQVHEPT